MRKPDQLHEAEICHNTQKLARPPRDGNFDATLPILLGRGYNYIGAISRKHGVDIFRTRLLMRPAVCVRGEEAARLFYDERLFMRSGAVPFRIRQTLLGEGGVHGLDGSEHANRKQMFMSLMDSDNVSTLTEIATHSWEAQIVKWARIERVVLFDEAQIILCRAACEWSGVPIEGDIAERARDMAAMVDAFGAVGPRHWRGRMARKRSEKWIRGIVEQVRTNVLSVLSASAAQVIASHRDSNGQLLSADIAAVELINVIRPTVAAAYLITFLGLALHQYPEATGTLERNQMSDLKNFVNEVRRFYPFAPIMGAIAREDVGWKGYAIPKGTLVVLDLYGTNHDERIWDRPDDFRPERFRNWNGGSFNFIPQGGGDFPGHRCAGEWITIELLTIALRFLATRIKYNVPDQDLTVRMNRIPALPKSRFVIDRVKLMRP